MKAVILILSISLFSFNLMGQEVEPTSDPASSCSEVGTDTAGGCGSYNDVSGSSGYVDTFEQAKSDALEKCDKKLVARKTCVDTNKDKIEKACHNVEEEDCIYSSTKKGTDLACLVTHCFEVTKGSYCKYQIDQDTGVLSGEGICYKRKKNDGLDQYIGQVRCLAKGSYAFRKASCTAISLEENFIQSL
jgi:hypothetical protein